MKLTAEYRWNALRRWLRKHEQDACALWANPRKESAAFERGRAHALKWTLAEMTRLSRRTRKASR